MKRNNMNWKVIKTATQYKKAIKRTMSIFQSAAGTTEADELDLLLVLVKDYEDKHIVLPQLDPIDAFRLKMADLYSYGHDVFEEKESFNRWMNKPNMARGNKKPIDCIDTIRGIEEIKKEIGRIEWGVY